MKIKSLILLLLSIGLLTSIAAQDSPRLKMTKTVNSILAKEGTNSSPAEMGTIICSTLEKEYHLTSTNKHLKVRIDRLVSLRQSHEVSEAQLKEMQFLYDQFIVLLVSPGLISTGEEYDPRTDELSQCYANLNGVDDEVGLLGKAIEEYLDCMSSISETKYTILETILEGKRKRYSDCNDALERMERIARNLEMLSRMIKGNCPD